MTAPVLEVRGISKRFGGVQALDNVSLSIQAGEVHCLAGENGSGKSTLIKIISGAYSADDGTIIIAGKEFRNLHPIEAIRQGVQVIYQDFSLFPNLTVAENLAINAQLEQKKRFVRWKEVREIAQKALSRISVKIDLDRLVEDLSVADRQLIAICRSLLYDAKLIIMDEPTAALSQREIVSLLDTVNKLKADGIAVLFVSHKLREVTSVSERVTVLRNGKLVAEGPVAEFNERAIAYHMTGREMSDDRFQFTDDPTQPPLMRVKGLTRRGSFEDVSFDVRQGEIVGVTGLLGCGRTDLALALFGKRPYESGEVFINEKPVKIENIQSAVRHGIAYVPEDRLTEGLFLPQSIGKNIVVTVLDKLVDAMRLLRPQRMTSLADEWVRNLKVATPSSELPVSALSGGNQQRVVLAKWLAADIKILILNGPTVGVDVGSKEDIHLKLRELARGGVGIVIVSDDLPEVVQNCNRVFLMHKGRFVNEFSSPTVTEDDITDVLGGLN